MSRYTRQEDKEIYIGKIIGNSIGKWEVVKKETPNRWSLKGLSTGKIIRGILTTTIERIMKEGRAMKEGRK